MAIPPVLKEIESFLNGLGRIRLVSGNNPRQDSAISENGVVQIIQNEGKWVVKSKNAVEESNTSWFDFTVATNDATKFYVNVKISELRNSADNTNCMGGIYYVLTGSVPPNSMIRIDKKLKRSIRENNNDYYFLVINKKPEENRLKNAYVCSLRTLKEIKPTGNNLPFQCVWASNIVGVERSYTEAKDFCSVAMASHCSVGQKDMKHLRNFFLSMFRIGKEKT